MKIFPLPITATRLIKFSRIPSQTVITQSKFLQNGGWDLAVRYYCLKSSGLLHCSNIAAVEVSSPNAQ